jgi:hypothetical protein
LTIKVLSETNEEVTKQIREVEIICKAYDKINGNISLDASLNFNPGMKSLFLFYQDNKLISLLQRYNAGIRMSYLNTDPKMLTEAIIKNINTEVNYKDVPLDGAKNTVKLLSRFL